MLGIFLAGKIRRDAKSAQLLDDQGVTTEAVISRVWRGGGKEHEPRVSYRFENSGGVYSRSVQAPQKLWQGMKVGQSLRVRYVPSQPTISHPVDWPPSGLPVWFPYVMTATMAFTAAPLWWLLARQIRLLSEGQAAPGRITAIRRGKGVVAIYEFELPNGTTIKGRSNVRNTPAVGSQVCILYDPDHPKRNAVYPLPFVRLDK